MTPEPELKVNYLGETSATEQSIPYNSLTSKQKAIVDYAMTHSDRIIPYRVPNENIKELDTIVFKEKNSVEYHNFVVQPNSTHLNYNISDIEFVGLIVYMFFWGCVLFIDTKPEES